MTWLTPWLGGIAGAIAIPSLIILYFLKLRRRDVEISTTLLWKKAIEDLQANAPFQKLRRNILLLLQLLALGAALVAVGQPQIKGDSPIGARHVILIDRSASMSALDAKTDDQATASRLEAAKEQALKFIDTLREPGIFDRGAGDQAMVIAFDSSAKALQTFTGDKDLLKAAVKAIKPSDAPSSLDEAMKLVLAQAPREKIVETKSDGSESTYERPPKPVGTIHLWSDGRLPDAGKVSLSDENHIQYEAMGSADSANIGITSLRAGRAFDNPNKLTIFVGLQSTFRESKHVEVECRIDNVVVGIKQVDLAAAAKEGGVVATPPAPAKEGETPAEAPKPKAPDTWTAALGGTVFNLDRPQGGLVTIHVSPGTGDVLAVDNQAALVVPPAKKLAVAVVTRGNLFIGAALESLPLSELKILTPEEYEAARTAGKLNYDVVILDGYLPKIEKDAPTPLPPGRYLVFGAVPPPPLGLVDEGEGAGAVFLDWNRDHPALRGISFDEDHFGKARKVSIPKGSAATSLASNDNGPAIVELAVADCRAIVVPTNIMDTDWPIHLSFVVFVAQAVGYLGDDSSGLGQMVQPGGILSDRLPIGATDVKVSLPDRTSAEMGAPAADGKVVYGPIEQSGIYEVSWTGKPGPSDAEVGGRSVRPFAANLLDAAESDCATVTKLELASRPVAAETGGQTKVAKRLWPWLILGALGVILLEWFVYNRKVQL